jgi:hypothetical protein
MENFRLLPGSCESKLQMDTSLLLYVIKLSLGMQGSYHVKIITNNFFLHLLYALFCYLLQLDIIFCVFVHWYIFTEHNKKVSAAHALCKYVFSFFIYWTVLEVFLSMNDEMLLNIYVYSCILGINWDWLC